jgi:hypothetical protein
MANTPFSVNQENSIRIAAICRLIVAADPEWTSIKAAT